MTRRHITFECEGSSLVATLDEAPGTTALLLVSGGNEVRAGAWNGQARFAARIAAQGFTVLRFDRRGIGDSEGENTGFTGSADDLLSAVAALRHARPDVTRIFAMGNCDAASALMLAGGAGCDGLILSNPWTFEDESAEEEAPAEVVRAHYRRRLADPAAIRRLLTGKVGLRQLVRSLVATLRPPPPPDSGGLAHDMRQGILAFGGPVRFLIAGRDRTGLAFTARWDKADPRLRTCPDATHSYVEAGSQDWLVQQVIELLQKT